MKLKTNKIFIKKQDQKFKIKRIRIEAEISTTKRANYNFQGRGEENNNNKKGSLTTNQTTTRATCHSNKKGA